MAIKRIILDETPTSLEEGTEVYVKDGASFKHFIGNVEKQPILVSGAEALEIVAEIPTTLEPQQRVFVTATGSEWIGADPANGLFPTLTEGTPWPAKGYKELYAEILLDDGEPSFAVGSPFIDETNVSNLSRISTGLYEVDTDLTSAMRGATIVTVSSPVGFVSVIINIVSGGKIRFFVVDSIEDPIDPFQEVPFSLKIYPPTA